MKHLLTVSMTKKHCGSFCSILSEGTMDMKVSTFLPQETKLPRNGKIHRLEGAVARSKTVASNSHSASCECGALEKCTLGKSLTDINYISIFDAFFLKIQYNQHYAPRCSVALGIMRVLVCEFSGQFLCESGVERKCKHKKL